MEQDYRHAGLIELSLWPRERPERPMYFNYHGWATGGHDTLGYGI